MENNNAPPGKGFIRRVIRWLANVLIITTIVFLFELLMTSLHWDSWEVFSGKIEWVDNSILSFSKQVSPYGLYETYTGNHAKYRYGLYFYKFSAPFNITRACTAMQKRVFLPPTFSNPLSETARYWGQEKLSDSITSDEIPLDSAMKKWNLPLYEYHSELLGKEPEYLQNACSVNITSAEVINESRFERSGWEWILAIPDSILTWMKQTWNYDDGNANWPGRIFLLWSLLFAAFATGATGSEKEVPGLWKKIFGFLGRFLLSMIFFGLVALLIGGVIWTVLEIGKGVQAVAHAVSGFVAGVTFLGGFIRLFFVEVREHLSFEGKQKVAESVRGHFFRGLLKKRK